jgi:hypothetical protein
VAWYVVTNVSVEPPAPIFMTESIAGSSEMLYHHISDDRSLKSDVVNKDKMNFRFRITNADFVPKK